MRKKYEEPISIKFIFFIVFMLALTMYYVFRDDNLDKISETKTYEEMLEYHDGIHSHNDKNIEENKKKVKTNNSSRIKKQRQSNSISNEQTVVENIQNTNNVAINYDELLDKLKLMPFQSSFYVNLIVDKLLEYKGYPKGTVKVISSKLNQSRAKVQGSYLIANFDIKSGTLSLEESILNQLDITTLIAVLAHELDHFDKLASVCRFMGVEQFEILLNKNGIRNVNTTFWRIASAFGKTKNFNGEYYQQALERFVSQNKLNQQGAYADFYKLSENLRNPLEISAYKESDYVYKHFGINVQEGYTQKLVKKFNDIDWVIYDKIAHQKLYKNERISIFDYFYAQSILTQFPDLVSTYDICVNSKNGDLTTFWNTYKNKFHSFYQNNGQLNASDYTTIMTLLNSTEAKIKNNISKTQIANAMANKINTQKNVKLNSEEIETLKLTIENYLSLLKENSIENKKQELICDLMLICIENQLYTNNTNVIPSLYYLKMPAKLTSLYDIRNSKQKLLPIYNNEAFKQEKPSHLTDQEYLIEIINKNRLNVN